MTWTKNITPLILGALFALFTFACDGPEDLCVWDLSTVCYDNKVFECEELGQTPGGWGPDYRVEVVKNCGKFDSVCKEYEDGLATCIDPDMICPDNTEIFCDGNNRYICRPNGVSPWDECEDGFKCRNNAELNSSGLSVAKCEEIE